MADQTRVDVDQMKEVQSLSQLHDVRRMATLPGAKEALLKQIHSCAVVDDSFVWILTFSAKPELHGMNAKPSLDALVSKSRVKAQTLSCLFEMLQFRITQDSTALGISCPILASIDMKCVTIMGHG